MKMEVLEPIDLGDGSKRYRKLLRSDPCDANSQVSRLMLLELLRTMGSSPQLIACGPSDPERINIYHDGQSWAVDLESVGTAP